MECQTTVVAVYLTVQAGHPVQVHQGVLGFQPVLGNLGNREILCLLADLGYLNLEVRGLLSLRFRLGTL